MSYKATVYKVFIASPSDVVEERQIVKKVIAKWNSINSEITKSILLPVEKGYNTAPELYKNGQHVINEEALADSDLLIAIFFKRIGTKTANFKSGTVEEIERHVANRKLAMLYFSNEKFDMTEDYEQKKLLDAYKEECRERGLYQEFNNVSDFEEILFNNISQKMRVGKLRTTFDSDILATVKNDVELSEKIKKYVPMVSKNLLMKIYDEIRSDDVWLEILKKLKESPADLRDILLFLAKNRAFRHYVYKYGYIDLANVNQDIFGDFMNDLYVVDKFEFYSILEEGLLKRSDYTIKMLNLMGIDLKYLK